MDKVDDNTVLTRYKQFQLVDDDEDDSDDDFVESTMCALYAIAEGVTILWLRYVDFMCVEFNVKFLF